MICNTFWRSKGMTIHVKTRLTKTLSLCWRSPDLFAGRFWSPLSFINYNFKYQIQTKFFKLSKIFDKLPDGVQPQGLIKTINQSINQSPPLSLFRQADYWEYWVGWNFRRLCSVGYPPMCVLIQNQMKFSDWHFGKNLTRRLIRFLLLYPTYNWNKINDL